MKIRSILMILAVFLFLVGCASTQSAPDTTAPAQTEEAAPVEPAAEEVAPVEQPTQVEDASRAYEDSMRKGR